MPVRKKRKTLLGDPSEMDKEQVDTTRRLTGQKREWTEDALAIMRSIVQSKMAAAEAVGVELEKITVTDVDQTGDEDPAEILSRVAHARRRLQVSQVMTIFLTSIGSSASTRKGKCKTSVPVMGPADIRPFLREPLGKVERPCCAGSECYALAIRDWPADKLPRALVLPGETRQTGYCVICHDFLVSKFVLDQTKKDPRWRFTSDPCGTGATHAAGHPVTINEIQYLFGPGGFKPCLRMTEMDLKPIHGVVGSVIVPSLGHYHAYEEDGVWRLDDSERHFTSPSA